jgi:Raf kinase inhibitor-like YbhB/YbcL family protein
MKLVSKSFEHNGPVPTKNAMGVASPGGPVPGPNKSPHLAWSDFPPATKSFVILCKDPDVPSRGDDVNKADRKVPYDLPRVDFYHWVLVDIPPETTELTEAADSDGLTARGKKLGKTELGVRGINDFTNWFAGDPEMEGDYGGYDGPWPPFNDERLHHYHFTVYALDVPALELPERFGGSDALRAMKGHVIDEATIVGTYTLNSYARE